MENLLKALFIVKSMPDSQEKTDSIKHLNLAIEELRLIEDNLKAIKHLIY